MGGYVSIGVCLLTRGDPIQVRTGGGWVPQAGQHGEGTPSLDRRVPHLWMGGDIPHLQLGGTPARLGQGGTPSLDGGYPGQAWGTLHPEMGYPPSVQGWGPLRIGQQMEYLIRSGRYASCVHAGGLSCNC